MINFSLTAKVIDDDKIVVTSLSDISCKTRLERAMVFKDEAWDVNINQHIRQRFT